MTILDFDGRAGRALNLEGFTNFQKPLAFDVLQKAVEDGKIVAISPAGQLRLNQDIVKAVETEFDGHDKLANAVIEIRKFRRVLVQKGEHIEEYLVKATPAKEEGDEQLEKSGGEGSRGGKVIGHTKSGKPIYQSGSLYQDETDEELARHKKKFTAKINSFSVSGEKRVSITKHVFDHSAHVEREIAHRKRVHTKSAHYPGQKIEKAVEKEDIVEKGDEYYALNGGIATQDGKPLPLLKTGQEIRTALTAMMQKLQAENAVLFSKMTECVTAIGFGPLDAPYDAADRALGNRYAWEVCRQYDPVEGAIPVEGQPANQCRAYNDYFNCYCSNTRSIKLCGAYIANLKDNKEYQLNSGLYTLLFQ